MSSLSNRSISTSRSYKSPLKKARYRPRRSYPRHNIENRQGFISFSKSASRSRTPSQNNRDQSDSDHDSLIIKKRPFMSFKEFLLHQKDDITPEESKKLYDQYKNEYRLTKTKIFFERHKDEEWFLEKYNPIFLSDKFEKSMMEAKIKPNNFFERLAKGNIKEIEDDVELYISRNEKEDGQATDPSTHSPETDENSNSKKKKIEVIEISDDEELDPKSLNSQFKLSDQFGKRQPFIQREIYFLDNSVFVQSIPLKITRNKITEVFSKIKGFKKLLLSEPIVKNHYYRYCWVTYDNQESCKEAMMLTGKKIVYSNEHPPLFLHIFPKRKSTKRVKMAPYNSLDEYRVSKDINTALKIIDKLSKEKGITDKFTEEQLDPLKPKIRKLNLLIAYLREVHYFCYYCGFEYGHEEILMSRCGKKHLRNSKYINKENYKEWTVIIDDRLEKSLNSKNKNKLTNWKEKQTKTFLEKNANKISEGKYRCGLCSKLFRAPEFIFKHIHNKHSLLIEKGVKEVELKDYFDNYKNDEYRIKIDNFESLIPGFINPMDESMSNIRNMSINSRNGENKRYFKNDEKEDRFRYRRKRYKDLDKPSQTGEVDIDYGFGDTRPPVFI